jgi:hypothetical protein
MRVFISHQWRDKQVADELKLRLEGLTGADVWIDYRHLRPGDKIQESIDEVLTDVDVMLVLWSEHSAVSGGVAAEIDTADTLGVRIIPCFISYDDAGNVDPPVEGAISQYLGVDFHHFATGVASLSAFLIELRGEGPAEKAVVGADDPRVRMLRRMREGAAYLANYRNVKGVDDDRRYWVTQIVGELERYVAETSDTDTAAQMVAGLELIKDNDPEAYEAAMARLGPIVGGATGRQTAPPVAEPDPETSWEAEAPPADMLDQALVNAGAAEGDIAGYRQAVEAYLNNAGNALSAMAAAVTAVQSPAGIHVVQYLNGYLNQGDDLIPDHHGLYGQLDDGWLILNTAYRLIESRVLTVHQVPIDWNTVMNTDAIVRALIPPQALAALEQQMMQLLGIIANEIASYQPWMTPTGGGYSPSMAWGGSWEDQMAQGMAELGISF